MAKALELVSVRERREQVVARLAEAFARDELDVRDFEARVERAQRAGDVASLDALVGDLGEGRVPRPISASEALVPAAAPARALARADAEREASKTLFAMMGGVERRGQWLVPRKLRVMAFMGGIDLDFREAVLGPGVTHVHVAAVMGGVDIVVPPGMRVEVDGTGIMGGFGHNEQTKAPPDPDAPVLRISGVALMGGVDVDTRYPGESRREARKREKLEKKAARKALPAKKSTKTKDHE